MNEFAQIDIDKAKELLSHSDVTLVDIRDAESYKQAHIPQAITVSDDTIEAFLKNTDKNKPLICYCYQGMSSQLAAQYFSQEGFKKVFSIIGGFEKWRTHYETVPS